MKENINKNLEKISKQTSELIKLKLEILKEIKDQITPIGKVIKEETKTIIENSLSNFKNVFKKDNN